MENGMKNFGLNVFFIHNTIDTISNKNYTIDMFWEFNTNSIKGRT